MSRGYWAGMMLVSLLVFLGAGAFVYFKLQEKSTVEVPLTPPQRPLQPVQKPPAEPLKPTVSTPTAKVPVEKPAVTKRNILFSYYSGSAKSVALVGDFNNWKRTKLEKKGKRWTTAIKIEPGTYKYLYVVDGQRRRDPNNKKVSKDRKSILTVKPL